MFRFFRRRPPREFRVKSRSEAGSSIQLDLIDLSAFVPDREEVRASAAYRLLAEYRNLSAWSNRVNSAVDQAVLSELASEVQRKFRSLAPKIPDSGEYVFVDLVRGAQEIDDMYFENEAPNWQLALIRDYVSSAIFDDALRHIADDLRHRDRHLRAAAADDSDAEARRAVLERAIAAGTVSKDQFSLFGRAAVGNAILAARAQLILPDVMAGVPGVKVATNKPVDQIEAFQTQLYEAHSTRMSELGLIP